MRDLMALCTSLLSEVEGRWADAGGQPLPLVSYVAAGALVAYDSAQVTVNVARIFAGRPGQEFPVTSPFEVTVLTVDLQVMVLRDAPLPDDSGAPPSAALLNASATLAMADLGALTQVLSDVSTDRSASSLIAGGVPVLVGPVEPVGPEGGIVGSVGHLLVQAV